jgi:hypothetical protein
VSLGHSLKRARGNGDEYWYWIEDRHSHTLEAMRDWAECVSRGRLARHVRFTLNNLPMSYPELFARFFLDKPERALNVLLRDVSRTAGDTRCSLSLLDYSDKACVPYILNANGRTYDRDALVQAIEATLPHGHPLRLEDGTIEPEHLQKLVLYPNASLGARADYTVLVFEDREVAIHAFDERVQLEERPAFWDDVARTDPAYDEMWNMAGAAAKHGFAKSDRESRIVVANQRCVGRRFLQPHPKISCGTVTFRNCEFRHCDVDLKCWCGPRFHGCRFIDCRFHFHGDYVQCKDRAKRCEILGGTVVLPEGILGESFRFRVNAWMWLQRHVGNERIVCGDGIGAPFW